MYTFRLWFAAERDAIAREHVIPLRDGMLAKALDDYERDVIIKEFDRAVEVTAHNIHPLVIMGLRKRITH